MNLNISYISQMHPINIKNNCTFHKILTFATEQSIVLFLEFLPIKGPIKIAKTRSVWNPTVNWTMKIFLTVILIVTVSWVKTQVDPGFDLSLNDCKLSNAKAGKNCSQSEFVFAGEPTQLVRKYYVSLGVKHYIPLIFEISKFHYFLFGVSTPRLLRVN